MVRILLILMALIFAYSTSAEAGWLGDKLKQAAENVGDSIINDTADSVYKGTKDAVTPEDENAAQQEPPQYETDEAAPMEQESYDSGEYAADESGEYAPDDAVEYGFDPDQEEMEEPSWGESGFGGGLKKRKKTGPPRTDLHLTAEMVIIDPESSPEPMQGKIYLDGARSRTEFNFSGDNSSGVIVTGMGPDDKVYVLMHATKQYMESSYSDTDSIMFESGKPCEGYRKADDLGSGKLNGRNIEKWRCSEPEDPDEAKSVMLWLDDRMEIPIRIEEENKKGYWELQNIREGSPPADVFTVPAGYTKLAGGAIPTALSLPAQDEKLIKDAGIPLYSKAPFVYGNASVGYRFASSEPVEAVRNWYKNKLSSWPVYEDKNDSWIIYQGKPGADMAQLLMQKTQVSVQKNDKLPEWHSLDKNMTTEIVIFVVQ